MKNGWSRCNFLKTFPVKFFKSTGALGWDVMYVYPAFQTGLIGRRGSDVRQNMISWIRNFRTPYGHKDLQLCCPYATLHNSCCLKSWQCEKNCCVQLNLFQRLCANRDPEILFFLCYCVRIKTSITVQWNFNPIVSIHTQSLISYPIYYEKTPMINTVRVWSCAKMSLPFKPGTKKVH